ncbi:Pheophytinase [Chlorella vulgaris]
MRSLPTPPAASLSGRQQQYISGALPHAAPLCRLSNAVGARPRAPLHAAAGRLHQNRVLAQATQAATDSNSGSAEPSPAGPLLLWYKRDLRLDDHPGWHAAAAAAGSAGVVPVFCFDPARYAHLVLPRGGAEGESLVSALESLDRSLRQHGSALMVRVGAWEQQVPQLAAELKAGGVVAELEVEADWRQAVQRVATALPEGAGVQHWQAPLLPTYADDFRDVRALRSVYNAPLPVLPKLPRLPSAAAAQGATDGGIGVDSSSGSSSSSLGISSSQLRQLASEAYRAGLSPALQAAAAAHGPSYGGGGGASLAGSTGSVSFSDEESNGNGNGNGRGPRLIERLVSSSTSTAATAAGSSAAAGADCEPGLPAGTSTSTSAAVGAGQGLSMAAEVAAEFAAGEGPVMRALGSYLRHLETAADGGSVEAEAEAAALAQAIASHDLPATPDGCFPALFGRALSLGVVSKRRVYSEAAAILSQQPEQPWPAGFGLLSQLAWLLTSSGGAAPRLRRQRKAAAAAAAAEARDFHEQMAAGREGQQAHGATLHHWRWQGLITDYLAAPAAQGVAGVGDQSTRPAILLCHGFGAFSEHYRDNVAALAAAGYDVYSPTLPGYGRSEKPVLPYGQDLWTQFLADFVLQVVRRPVVVAGNSIGGFISASLAADYPGLVQGLVLLNSAGRIQQGYQPPAEPAKASPPPPFVVEGVARTLFAFLEGNVSNQLRRVYPVRPQRADSWLGGEIARAARDPGALGVFRSVFYLPPPRPLNYLVSRLFGGPTLVLQGLKDPLNNAPARADELARACSNATIVKLDAGHCPHDEVPEICNAAILQFIEEQVLPNNSSNSNGSSKSNMASNNAAVAVAVSSAPAAAK